MSGAPPRVSVVILTANRREKLRRALGALADGELLPAEVVVVVNESGDGTREMIADLQEPFEIRVVDGVPGGYAEARNHGVSQTREELVAFLDDDCYADRHWLARMAEGLAEHDAVGGLVLPSEKLRVPPDFHPELNWLVGLSGPGLLDSERGGRIDLPSTSNVAFRRRVWEENPFQTIGGRMKTRRDKANYLLGREDAQWWRTLRRRGVRCSVVRRAIVWHDIDPTRYSVDKSFSRAEADGRAHWRRSRPRHELAAAARDIVHQPARILHDLFREGTTVSASRRLHSTWARRQSSLLGAAVLDQNHGISPAERTSLLLRAAKELVSAEIRPLARGIAAFGHHTFKSIRRVPTIDNPPSRITVVSYNNLGDAVLTLPMLGMLRREFPDAGLTLLLGAVAAPLFADSDLVDDVVVLPSGLSDRSPRDVMRVFGAMRKTRPDVIVVTYFHGPSPLGLFASTDAPVICWDRDHGMKQQLWQDLATVIVPKSMRKPEIAAMMDLLAPMGIEGVLERPRLVPTEAARARVAEVLAKHGLERGRFVYLNVDGREGGLKFWPPDRWRDVARELHERTGLRIVCEGTRAGRRHFEAMELPESTTVSVHGFFDTMELAALLECATIAIGADSGPMHVAQAVGTPMVAMFGHCRERCWAPLPRLESDGDAPLPFRALRAPDGPDDWMFEERADLPENELMLRIQPPQVVEAAMELLTTYSSASGTSSFTG